MPALPAVKNICIFITFDITFDLSNYFLGVSKQSDSAQVSKDGKVDKDLSIRKITNSAFESTIILEIRFLIGTLCYQCIPVVPCSLRKLPVRKSLS